MLPFSKASEITTRCGSCPIRFNAVCALCSPDELSHLDTIKSYQTYSAGDQIAWAGENMTHVGSVVSGVATLSSTMADGRRQMVGLLLPSDFLGRPGRDALAFDVMAATDITFCMFRKPDFEQTIANSHNLGRRLLQMTLDELDAAREWMLLLGRKTASEKVASLFVIMARRNAALQRHTPTGEGIFPLYLTREAMADYVGLTVETVSRQISALRREGLIELRDHRFVHVPDFERLLQRSAQEVDGGSLG